MDILKEHAYSLQTSSDSSMVINATHLNRSGDVAVECYILSDDEQDSVLIDIPPYVEHEITIGQEEPQEVSRNSFKRKISGQEDREIKRLYLAGEPKLQQVVQNVHQFFMAHFALEPNSDMVAVQATAAAIGVGEEQVKKYKHGPVDKKRRILKRNRKSPATSLTTGQYHEIRMEIYQMYVRKVPVTLKTLSARLKKTSKFNNSIMSLYRVLKKLGFTYKKDDPNRGLRETPHIQAMRREFFRSYMKNEEQISKKPCVFLDETWVYANGVCRRSWQDDDPRSVKKTSGEGARYIVLHAGSETGFVENSGRVFKSKKGGDYHQSMDANYFEEWVEHSLLPNLEEPSLIVIDNASYQSRLLEKYPATNWNKASLANWLEEKGVYAPLSTTKAELLSLVKQIPRSAKAFVVDDLIRQAGHEVIRLPPYHPQYNAIELVWSQAKREYDKLVLQLAPTDAWELALSKVSPENWNSYVKKVDRRIKSEYEKEKLIMVDPVPIIINLDEDDISSSEEEYN